MSQDEHAGGRGEPQDRPFLPDYAGRCVRNIVPALLRRAEHGWVPEAVVRAPTRVLLVIDGLGFEQLRERSALAPTLSALAGEAITTIAPSTTAAALTSITTGLAPSEHGLIGYQMRVGGEKLDVLRWTIEGADARQRLIPGEFQPIAPFGGERAAVITKLELARSGFSGAHLAGAEMHGYRVASGLAVSVGQLAREGRPFIYAYYDGIDNVGHQHGFGPHYDAELVAVDRMVSDLLRALPAGVSLVVTADHGHVHVGKNLHPLADSVRQRTANYSGEGRFLWLHARPGEARELRDAALASHGDEAWVVERERIIDERWLGPSMSSAVAARCGDLALVARRGASFTEPGAHDPPKVGRHGATTAAEMRVPFLWALS